MEVDHFIIHYIGVFYRPSVHVAVHMGTVRQTIQANLSEF